MHNSAGRPASHPDPFKIACGEIEKLLAGPLYDVARALTADERASYLPRPFAAGWRIPVTFDNGEVRQLDLLLPPGVPWQAPRVALVDRPAFLTWPHVEKDGLICLASDNLDVDPKDPVGAVSWLLGQACPLIDKLMRGECIEDFRDEFLSYWNWKADHKGSQVISLINPGPPSREVRVWCGDPIYLIADDEEAIRQWLLNFRRSLPKHFSTQRGMLVWSGSAPIPAEYPESGPSLYKSLAASDKTAKDILGSLVLERPAQIVSLLGFATVNGPALGVAIVRSRLHDLYGPADRIGKGFRPGAIPEKILVPRYLGQSILARAPVERADHGWVHGRGHDERSSRLQNKRVAVIGCGSVGAAVAVALAQAGVGCMHLIDFDIMQWANISRHPLGAVHVGQKKASALAEKLRADFPHLKFESHVDDVDALIRLRPEILDACDLIISATGRWSVDARLDSWQENGVKACPVIYAWTEANASAGHAVLIPSGPIRLRDGFDRTGRPNLRMTKWPSGDTERQEPACGAVYQPYGPIELGFINSLTAELALDALLGIHLLPIHRIWVGAQTRLTTVGGEWSVEAAALIGNRAEGSFALSLPWANATTEMQDAALCA